MQLVVEQHLRELMNFKNLLNMSLLALLISCGGADGDGLFEDGISDGNHRVFVTSNTYNGNLGGISGADSICNTEASSSGLKRTYKAILSSSLSSAFSRLNLTGKVYVFSDSETNSVVVNLGTDLWNTGSGGADLLSSINIDTNYNVVSLSPWTGTDSDGSITLTGDMCQNWTSSSAAFQGQTGSTSSLNDSWIEGISSNCNLSRRLYCISI